MRGNGQKQDQSSFIKQQVQYIVFSLILMGGFFLLRSIAWTGNASIHTLMETIATTLAFMVGMMALVRFYAKKDTLFLIMGAAFIGTGMLDGYHTVVTSSLFVQFFSSSANSLIPWSWVASRYFLSIMMFLSWVIWRREKILGQANSISPKVVYFGVGGLTLASFLFFSLYPLPRAFYPELFLGRPEEIGAAFFFFLALVGFYTKGGWRQSKFEHWLIMSLIAGFFGQILFMSSSYHLFDTMFDLAHVLKKISYIFVLTGLLISMYYLFRETENIQHVLLKQNSSLEQVNAELETTKKLLANKNDEIKQALEMAEIEKQKTMEKMYELEQTSKAMVGRELEMIALKKRVEELQKKGIG